MGSMDGDAHSFLAQAGSALLSLTPQTSNAWKKRPLPIILTHLGYQDTVCINIVQVYKKFIDCQILSAIVSIVVISPSQPAAEH